MNTISRRSFITGLTAAFGSVIIPDLAFATTTPEMQKYLEQFRWEWEQHQNWLAGRTYRDLWVNQLKWDERHSERVEPDEQEKYFRGKFYDLIDPQYFKRITSQVSPTTIVLDPTVPVHFTATAKTRAFGAQFDTEVISDLTQTNSHEAADFVAKILADEFNREAKVMWDKSVEFDRRMYLSLYALEPMHGLDSDTFQPIFRFKIRYALASYSSVKENLNENLKMHSN